MSDQNTGPSRRSVAKGVAWTTPVILAAVAAPAAAASPTPTCPNCFKAGSVGAFTSQVMVSGNRGTLAFMSVFNIDASACNLSLFQPTYSILTTGATLTMSDGKTYTQTSGLGAGPGTLGQFSGVSENLMFSGISLPNGGSIISGYPVVPTKLCVNFVFILQGFPSLIQIQCPQTLCWKISSTATGAVLFGAGTLNYSGFLSPA